MTLIIRPETPADYGDVGLINVRAFGERLDESLLVACLRQRPGFDPDLSLVAEREGRVLGHILFTPLMLRMLEADLNAVLLAPVAVDPSAQGQGVGAALVQEGHAIARRKGYSLSFLVGHPTYYPRFGYVQHVYGPPVITLPSAGLPAPDGITSRPPREADLPALMALWEHEESAVDFAIRPGAFLLDWLSINTAIEARVHVLDGEIIGYTRTALREPTKPRLFLARDAQAARRVAGALAVGGRTLHLPLHARSVSAPVFGEPVQQTWDAAMACPLASGAFDEYHAQLLAGKRPPGRVIWPTVFEWE